jgi:hypothetical protein
MKETKLKTPAITKDDIRAAGFSGKHIDVIYSFVKDMVLNGHYQNDREYLLHKLKIITISDGCK